VIYCDLYFIQKNPFYPQEKRVKYYYAFVLATGILIFGVTFIEFFEGENIFYYYTFIFITYFSTITYALSFTIIRLKQIGTSTKLKK
jgi:uncharacterized membrane protein YhaH (DUF805 family)